MTTPGVPSGWYDDGSGRQRWWDGKAWGEFAEPAIPETPSPATVVETSRRKPRGLAIAALIVGIVAFLTGLLPIVGAILGIVAVILGIVALVKKQTKGIGITAIVLGVIATVVSVVMAAGFAAFVANNSSSGPRSDPAPITSSAPAEEPDESSVPADSEPSEPSEPSAEESAAPDLTTFEEVDDRAWALIVKDPDAHQGKQLILYGTIMQFDSATGRCAMIVRTEATQQEMSYDYDQNVFAVAGDWQTTCPVFDPLVEDDHLKMWATVLESFSYDTQIGGNTTVPMVEVLQVELLPETEY